MTENNRYIKLLDNVSLGFDDVRVFDNLTLEVPKGRITTVVGPSGCGKSSILNLLSGLIEVNGGRVDVQGENIGYIFQEDRLLPWETVYGNIKIVRREENREEIMEILNALGLEDFADKYPDQLSGGMRQRCAIARGFYYHSTLLLMDEPFKSLDYDLKLNLIRYLGGLWEKTGNTIIFVTHDIDEALLLGHRILVFSNRPAKIIAVFERENHLTGRKVTDEAHIRDRREIIRSLTHKEGHL